MPWNNQGGSGGNPWGSGSGGSNGGGGGGGGSPWGGGSGGGGGNGGGRGPMGGGGGFGGGNTPPDLEEMMRRGQDRIKRLMPGGFGAGKGIALVVLVLIVLWGASGLYRVQPDQQGVVLRFGEHVATTAPGLNYHLPWPIETVFLPSVTTVNRLEIGFQSTPGGSRDVAAESIMLTADENLVDIDFTVLWRISDASDFLFNVRDREAAVKRASESAMREVIARSNIQPVLTGNKAEIENDVRARVQQIIDGYEAGIFIEQVQFQSVNPPQPVIDAFNEVQRAEQDRDRLRNQAEAYRNDIIPRARGEAERMIQEASAYREQVVNVAQGNAQRFTSVLEAYRTAPEVTVRRLYLETMQEVMSRTNKVIIDSGAEGMGQGVVPYLPLDQLRRTQSTN